MAQGRAVQSHAALVTCSLKQYNVRSPLLGVGSLAGALVLDA